MLAAGHFVMTGFHFISHLFKHEADFTSGGSAVIKRVEIEIAGVKLKNRSLDEVAVDLNEHVEILCLCRPDQFSQIISEKIFRQAMPVSKSVLIAWADMLEQLHYQRMPRRPQSDRKMISKAKELIMEQKQMDETEAHRYLQRLSMNLGLPMAKVAEKMIKEDSQK